MLQMTPQSKIFLATEAIDGRKGIDGIAAVCRQKLLQNPLDGAIFVFRNRSRTIFKLLCYDGQGFWLCTKRLSSGKFTCWPTDESVAQSVSHKTLYTLIYNGDPQAANFSQDWRSLT